MFYVVLIILFQTIVFFIIYFFLKKLMWGSTESAVNRLNEEYGEINKKKEELTVKIQQIEEEYKARKEETEKAVLEIKDKADLDIQEKKDESFTKAKLTAEKIIADAMSSQVKIREDIQREEHLKMLDTCEATLKRIFSDIVKGELNKFLVADFLREFENMDLGPVPLYVEEVEVVTSADLSDTMKKAIEEHISTKLKRKMSVKEVVDKKIIGGVIMKFGTLVVDGSLVGKLKDIIASDKQTAEDTRK
ncbi:MAG: F0F1 ATP synthase subunit delta [Candidatus Omnitrophota bacterium]